MIDADIRVEDTRWSKGGCDLEALVAECLAAAVAEVENAPDAADVALLFADDATQQALNRDYRGKDAATNVLSFPMGEMPLPPGAPRPLGDISFAYETIVQETMTGGITLDAHLRHLIIHGFLHLLGYDHEEDAQASAMEMTETRALARLGIADPYCPNQV